METWPGNPDNSFQQDTLLVDYVRVYEWGFPNSIKSTNLAHSISVYPNPVKNGQQLNFSFSSQKQKRIKIYNQVGIPVFHTEVSSEKLSVLLPALSAGIYFVDILDKEQNRFLKKILIK